MHAISFSTGCIRGCVRIRALDMCICGGMDKEEEQGQGQRKRDRDSGRETGKGTETGTKQGQIQELKKGRHTKSGGCCSHATRFFFCFFFFFLVYTMHGLENFEV